MESINIYIYTYLEWHSYRYPRSRVGGDGSIEEEGEREMYHHTILLIIVLIIVIILNLPLRIVHKILGNYISQRRS